MVRLCRGEADEMTTIKPHPVIVDIVRILPGLHAAGAEPDLPFLFVDAVYFADHPGALRDLILYHAF